MAGLSKHMEFADQPPPKNIPTSIRPTATKPARVVKHNEELAPITSNDPSIMWSCELTWQIKYVISLLAQVLWTLIIERW